MSAQVHRLARPEYERTPLWHWGRTTCGRTAAACDWRRSLAEEGEAVRPPALVDKPQRCMRSGCGARWRMFDEAPQRVPTRAAPGTAALHRAAAALVDAAEDALDPVAAVDLRTVGEWLAQEVAR